MLYIQSPIVKEQKPNYSEDTYNIENRHYRGKRLDAPCKATCPPKRNVVMPPGKYARTYATSAITYNNN